MRKTVLLAAASACLLTVSSVKANLVLNGGFETGNFADWTSVVDASITSVAADVHSGTYAADLTGPAAVISQELTLTSVPTVVSFWARSDSLDIMTIHLDGQSIFPVIITGTWTDYTFTVTPSAGSEFLTIIGGGNQAYVDDISVQAAVPETTTWVAGALLLLPFGVGAARALKKNRTA